MAAENLTAVTDATFGLEVEQHQGLTIVAGRVTWWRRSWTSWRESIRAS